MKIAAVTPPDAASDPKHPDHDRWVKEYTLKMEVEHAKRLGLSSRVAEQENQRQLARAEQVARAAPPPTRKKKPKIEPNQGHARRKSARGVTTRYAKPTIAGVDLSPCGRCGTCRRCRREKRVFLMWQKAREHGDRKCIAMLLQLGFYAQQAKDGTGRFAGINPRVANRMVIRRLEDVCDATIPTMGPWL